MRFAAAMIATLTFAAASAVSSKADAGVVVGVNLPVPAIVPSAYVGYGPAVRVGDGPAWYGRYGYWGPYRGPGYYRPAWRAGFYHGGFNRGGYRYGVYGHGWYRR